TGSCFEAGSRPLTVSEDGGNASIEVHRLGKTSGTQTAAFTTADGSATGGADYTPRTGTLTFAPGQAVTTIDVPIADDAVDEPAEKFTVTLSAPTGGASLGSTSSTEVTIADNDPPAPPADTTKPQLLVSVPSSLKS